MIAPDTLERAAEKGIDPAVSLAKNDSTGFFEVLDDLILSGPTFTNVNDLRAILIDPA
jgi:hydroxypyruvate reductase